MLNDRKQKIFLRTILTPMTLRDVANALGISTKLASRLVREGSIYGVKVGREYRVAKTTVMEYIMDRRTPGGYKKCVGSVNFEP